MSIREIQLMEDKGSNRVWADLVFDAGRLSRYDLSGDKLLAKGGLSTLFREVSRKASTDQRRFEMLQPVQFGDRPTDNLYEVVDRLRPVIWRGLSSVPEYRSYYVCLATGVRMPQALVLFTLLFYFGSVTRYRPHIFEGVLSEPLGGFVMEFIATAPDQLAYMLASEMTRREVIRSI